MLGAEGGEHEGPSCFYSLLFNERNKYLTKNICVLGCGPRVRLAPGHVAALSPSLPRQGCNDCHLPQVFPFAWLLGSQFLLLCPPRGGVGSEL